ncbi:calcium-binding protein [Microcoleus vaginatus]|uniref:calcium-binding protein n=1 Tax=Microcoleus vaginatus TaxID=119532 RepID=UPI001688A233|nr:calcium-binding protein [Microcoleus sp. FACHB-84]MBD2007245.1 calcium-binding protein [Microcoleus sp. FACHB-45]
MALKPDASGALRLIGDNTSEFIQLFPGDLTNFPLGAWALDGDDTVDGSEASELILGNEGEDVLRGFVGNDSVFGGKGRDGLYGHEGNDCLSGGLDADFIFGRAGDDILFGGRGNDLLNGQEGNNTLVGGLGRDFLSCEIGNNLCVLGIDPATTDINSSDAIAYFDPDSDRIGLASGLTVNDIVLEPIQNVTFTYTLDVSQALQLLVPPVFLSEISGVVSGTLIRVRNSNAILAFVDNVTPNELQSRIVSVQGF